MKPYSMFKFCINLQYQILVWATCVMHYCDAVAYLSPFVLHCSENMIIQPSSSKPRGSTNVQLHTAEVGLQYYCSIYTGIGAYLICMDRLFGDNTSPTLMRTSYKAIDFILNPAYKVMSQLLKPSTYIKSKLIMRDMILMPACTGAACASGIAVYKSLDYIYRNIEDTE